MPVTSFCDSKMGSIVTACILARDKSYVRGEIFGRSKSLEITNLNEYRQCCMSLNADEAAELLQSKMDCESIDVNKKVAKVSIVGAGMQSNAGVAAKMFEALYNVGVNIKMISTSEIRTTVLIAREDADKAMKAVHDAFIQD